MARVTRVQETGTSPVRAGDTSAAGRAVAKLGSTIVQVDSQIRNANRSRRVNDASIEMSRAITNNEAEIQAAPEAFESHSVTNDNFLINLREQLSTNAADEQEREQVNANFDRAELHSQNRVRQNARALSIRSGQASLAEMTDVLSTNYAELTTDVDRKQLVDGYTAAIDQAVVDGIIRSDQAPALREGFITAAEKLRAANDITDDPTTALTMLEEGDYNVTPEDARILKGQAKRGIAQEQSAREAAGAQLQQKTWTDLYDAIQDGDAGKADIEAMRGKKIPGTTKNMLSEQGTRALLGQLRRAQKVGQKKSDWREIYEDSIANGKALDHKTAAHREAVENAFLERLDKYESLPPDEANRAIVDELIRPTKIFPESLKREMRIAAKEADTPELQQYSELYSRVRRDPNASPALISMAPQDEAFWAAVSNLRDAGVFNAESIELARTAAYKMTDDDRRAVRTRYREKEYIDGNKIRFTNEVLPEFKEDFDMSSAAALATSAWSNLVEGAPPAPPGMVADYQNLVKTYYTLMPEDIDEARRLAKEAIMRAWVVEDDGSRRLVRAPRSDALEFPEAAPQPAQSSVQRNDEAAQAMQDLQPQMMRTEPVDTFDITAPDEYEPWVGASGFTQNLGDFERLAKEESAPANLLKWLKGKTDEAVQLERNRYTLDPNSQAINEELSTLEQAGKVDSPEYNALLDELEQHEESLNIATDKPDFSVSAIGDAFANDPGLFAAEMVNEIARNPLVLAFPIGWEPAAARAAVAATRAGMSAAAVTTAKVAAGATATGAIGGALGGGVTAAEQLGESGEISDPEAVALDAAFGAAAAVVLTGTFKGIQAATSKAPSKTPDAADKTPDAADKTPDAADKAADVAEPLEEVAKPNATPETVEAELSNFDFKRQSTYGEAFETAEQINALQKIVDEDEAFAALDKVNDPLQQRFGSIDLEETNIQKAMRTAIRTRQEAGRVDPKLLAATSLIGLGAAGGAIVADDPLVGAAGGAAAGVAAILAGRTLAVLGKGVVNGFKFVTQPDSRIRIDKFVDQWEGDVKINARATWQVKEAILKDVKSSKEREAISHFLEGDTTVKLSKEGKATAKVVRALFDEISAVAKREGVIKSHLENYVPHLWKKKGLSKSEIVNQFVADLEGAGAGMGKGTPHAKQRTIPTLARGQELGFEAQTLDIAEIFKIYSDGVYRAIRNKQLAEELREQIAPDGLPMVMDSKSAPSSYKQVSNMQFVGESVHPDIAPSLNFVYNADDPNVVMKGALALNFAMKRSLVSMSFFHANALIESQIFAGVGIHTQLASKAAKKVGLRVPVHAGGLKFTSREIVPPTSMFSALNMLRHGSAGDEVDFALRSGVVIGAIEDVGADSFYAAVDDVVKVADAILPVVGSAPVKAYKWLNQQVDTIMWDKIATGGKLAVFLSEMEKATLKNAAQYSKDPKKFPLIPKEQLGREVAEYVNDAFGGLNWRRIAEGTKTKIGRNVALAAFSPGGRRAMQLSMFAPDWTIANARVLLKAVPGQAKNKRIARMHQYYAARGAIFFGTVANGLNYMFTGRSIFTNEDKTTVDLGDGRRMTASKQFVEPFHWMTQPGSTAINKMGILPKTALELGLGVKYFSGKGTNPPLYADDADWLEKRAAEAGLIAKKFTPIFAQQVADQGVSGIAGFAGHPIYGQKLE